MRIENKLLRGIRDGEILPAGKNTQPLATWSNSYLRVFTSKVEVVKTIFAKLEDNDVDDKRYFAKFFFSYLPDILTTVPRVDRFVQIVSTAIKNDDYIYREALIENIGGFPSEWQVKFGTELYDLADHENPAVILDDGTPFLSAPTQEPDDSDDNIPF